MITVSYPDSGGDGKSPAVIVARDEVSRSYADLQSGLDNLPATGGRISLREGTYVLPASAVFPDKDLIIEGSGPAEQFVSGGATVLDIGAVVAPLLSLPASVSGRRIILKDLTLRGNFLVGQHALQCAGDFNTIILDNVTVQSCDFLLRDTGAVGNTYRLINCGSGDPGFEGVNGVFRADVQGSIVELYQSLLYYRGATCIAGKPGLVLSDSSIQNFFARATADLSYLNGATSTLGQMDITVTSFGDGVLIDGIYFTDSTLLIAGGQKNLIENCNFDRYTVLTPAISLPAGIDYCKVSGCVFDGYADGVLVASDRNIVSKNLFKACTRPINETTGDFNIFSDNNGFAGSVVSGVNSIQPDNIN